MTALWENDSLAFTFYCKLAHLHTCIHAYSQFFASSKSDLKWLRLSFYGKMSKEDANGKYWSILDNICQCPTLLGYIWQYWTNLNVAYNIKTLIRVSWSSHLINIEQQAEAEVVPSLS